MQLQVQQLHTTKFTTVKVCRDSSTKQLVVVKESSIQPSHQPTADCIDHERTIASRLMMPPHPHPHIVRFLHIESGGQVFHDGVKRPSCVTLVMEHCALGDLFTHLERKPDRAFSEAQALHYFRHIVRGVHHLHSLGFAHRDISLENVVLAVDDTAKICDFGLSVTTNNTCYGMVGKAQYMAPEVAAGAGHEPVAADVWSLGIVLFIMLTGSPLFALAEPSDAAWTAVERVGISGIVTRWGLEIISQETVDLLDSLLKLDSLRRPQSLATVLQALS